MVAATKIEKRTAQQTNGKSASEPRETIITVHQPKVLMVTLRLRGTSTLLVNMMSEEALQVVEDKQTGKGPGKTAARALRDPQAEFEGKRRKINGGAGKKNGFDAFPAIGIIESLATAGGPRFGGDKSSRTHIMGALSIDGDGMLEIHARPPTRKTDWSPKVKMPIYRPEYRDWYIDVPFRFDETDLSPANLLALAMNAGLKVGIGAYRKERSGLHGMFTPEVRTS